MKRGGPVPALRGSITALAFASLLGCDMTANDPASPGQVEVWLSAPQAHDQAFLIAWDTPVEEFVPADGFRHFPDPMGRSHVVLIVASSPMPAGETRVGSLLVRDLRGAVGIRATVVEAARSDHVLREGTDGYRIRLAW
jgi:hypothetical protein